MKMARRLEQKLEKFLKLHDFSTWNPWKSTISRYEALERIIKTTRLLSKENLQNIFKKFTVSIFWLEVFESLLLKNKFSWKIILKNEDLKKVFKSPWFLVTKFLKKFTIFCQESLKKKRKHYPRPENLKQSIFRLKIIFLFNSWFREIQIFGKTPFSAKKKTVLKN